MCAEPEGKGRRRKGGNAAGVSLFRASAGPKQNEKSASEKEFRKQTGEEENEREKRLKTAKEGILAV